MISQAAIGATLVRRLAGVQAMLAMIGAGICLAFCGMAAAGAMLAGGAVALANTLLLAWRMRGNKGALYLNAQQHLRTFYRSSLERFFVVMLLLAVGMGPLALQPLPLLAGFVLGQLALIVSSLLITGRVE